MKQFFKYLLILSVQFELPGQGLPGQGLILNTFRLLTNESVGQIIKITNDFEKMTPDGKYPLPDGILYSQHNQCNTDAYTFSSQNIEEFKKMRSDRLSIHGQQKEFQGKLTADYQRVQSTLKLNESVVSLSKATCSNYNLTWVKTNKAELTPEFHQLAMDLSPVYSKDAKQQYYDFIQIFGDHITTGCKVGGWIQQYAFTSTDYTKERDIREINANAQAQFRTELALNINDNSNKEVDKEFRKNTSFNSIENFGGAFTGVNSNFDQWADSIHNGTRVQCVSWQAQPMSWVFKQFPELQHKAAVMELALQDQFDRKGCTDPHSSNQDPNALVDDGSCFHKCAITDGNQVGDLKFYIKKTWTRNTCTVTCDLQNELKVYKDLSTNHKQWGKNCKVIKGACQEPKDVMMQFEGKCKDTGFEIHKVYWAQNASFLTFNTNFEPHSIHDRKEQALTFKDSTKFSNMLMNYSFEMHINMKYDNRQNDQLTKVVSKSEIIK